MSSEAVGRNPLPIVKEYLSSHEPRVRANAAVALAAIASRESLAELVKLALTDQDAEVHAAAVREVKGLTEDDRSYCVDLVIDDLDEPERQRQASTLIADLRNEGVPIRPLGLSFLDGLRLSTRSRSGSARGRRSLWRVLSASVLGGFLGAVILLIALEALGSTDRRIQGFLLVTTLAASALLGATAAHFSRPLSAYLDRRFGAAVEMGAVFLGTLLPLLALVLPYLLFWSLERNVPLQKLGAALLGGIVGAALFGGAIRGGTLIGAVAALPRPWQRLVAQALVGSATGLLVLTGLFLTVAVSLQKEGQLALAEFAAGWWLLLLPCGVGLAASIAVANPGAESGGFKQRLSAITVGVLLAATAIVLSWLNLSTGKEGNLSRLERLSKSETLEWGPFKELPVSRMLKLDFPQAVSIKTIVDERFKAKRIDLLLVFWSGSTRMDNADAEPPELNVEVQEAGNYQVELGEYSRLSETMEPEPVEETLRTSYFTVAGQLAHLDLGEKPGDDEAGFRLQVILNSKPGVALTAAVPDLLERGEVHEAFMAFDRAVKLEPSVGDSLLTLDSLCRFGSLHGYAKQVLEKCNHAAEIAPIDFILDSRGIARALAQDREGAAEDFRKVAEESADKAIRKTRKEWAHELVQGKDPLTPKTIADLLNASKTRSLLDPDKKKLAQRGLRLLTEGNFDRGAPLLEPALGGENQFWEELCWHAALRPEGKDPRRIVRICEKSSGLGILGLSISLARAKDWDGAITALNKLPVVRMSTGEEVIYFSDHRPTDGNLRYLSERRPHWIGSLRSGNDPFTPEERASIEEAFPILDMKQIEERLLVLVR